MADKQEILNEDWIKLGHWDLPKTLPRLLAVNALKNADRKDQVAWLKHLLTLPAAVAMPDELRRQVEQFIQGRPQRNRFVTPLSALKKEQ